MSLLLLHRRSRRQHGGKIPIFPLFFFLFGGGVSSYSCKPCDRIGGVRRFQLWVSRSDQAGGAVCSFLHRACWQCSLLSLSSVCLCFFVTCFQLLLITAYLLHTIRYSTSCCEGSSMYKIFFSLCRWNNCVILMDG